MDHAVHLLEGLDTLIVQDLVMTKTAELADVVFPASHASFESEGTVTNSERRVQRVRKALDPPGEARDDIWIIAQLAKRLGVPWGDPTPGGALGRDALALADAHADVVGADRGARRDPVAVQRGVPRRGAVPARAAVAVRRSGAAGAQGAVLRRDRRAAGGRAHRGVPDAADHRAPARVLQHRRAVGPVLLAVAPRARPSTSRPRTRRSSAWRRERSGADRLASRCDRGAGPRHDRRSAPGSRS